MSDVHDIKTRSYNMSQIRGKDTKPELYVRKFLYRNGIRYRTHYPKLPGKPDIVIIGKRIIVDVKGCFWHRHGGCKFTTTPKRNRDFYEKKFAETTIRDAQNLGYWLQKGWKVIEVWECELKNQSARKKTLDELLKDINQTI